MTAGNCPVTNGVGEPRHLLEGCTRQALGKPSCSTGGRKHAVQLDGKQAARKRCSQIQGEAERPMTVGCRQHYEPRAAISQIDPWRLTDRQRCPIRRSS